MIKLINIITQIIIVTNQKASAVKTSNKSREIQPYYPLLYYYLTTHYSL